MSGTALTRRALLAGIGAGAAGAVLGVPAGAAVEVALDIQVRTTPGGLRYWLVEEHSIPFAALKMHFLGGADLDPPGREGAVELMTGLLEEGAGARDATAFQEARQALAAEFRFSADHDSVSVGARFLSENRAASLALLRDALAAPRFDPEALERVRGQMLSIIRDHERDPSWIARRRFSAATFPGDPYARPSEGTAESVAALSRDDVVAAWRGALARDRVVIGLVGDVTGPEADGLLDQLLGDLPTEGAPLPGPAAPVFGGEVIRVRWPAPQAVAHFGQRGMARSDPDFFAAFVMNHILGGGGFSSRLMTEIREKRGLTYGVGTALVKLARADLLVGSMQAPAARMDEALALLRGEWVRMRDEGVSAAELEAAQKYLTGAYALRFAGNGRIADMLAGMQFQNMPPDYIRTRNPRIMAVTREDVARAARRLLDPEHLRIVVVSEQG